MAKETLPFPPRYWWLKRLGAAVVALIAMTFGIRLYWGWKVDRALASQLKQLTDAGELTDIDQIEHPKIPDALNAALVYQKALTLLDEIHECPRASTDEYGPTPPFSRRWFNRSHAAMQANMPALVMARSARSLQQADWGMHYSSTQLFPSVPSLNGARALANQLGDAALFAHLHGDDYEAMEYLADLLHLSETLGPEQSLIQFLISGGIESIALDSLQKILPAIQIADASSQATPATQPIVRMATREQLSSLQTTLLDQSRRSAMLREASVVERLACVGYIQQFGAASARMLSPAYTQAIIDLNQKYIDRRGVFDLPNWPARSLMLTRCSSSEAGTKDRRTIHGATLDYANNWKWLQAECLRCANKQLTGLEIALVLYRCDHGNFPEKLNLLIPEYLQQIPEDPMGPAGTKLGYVILPKALPDGRDRPLIFSIGHSDHGLTPPPGEPDYGRYDRQKQSDYRDLIRWSLPSTQPAEKESDVSENPGDSQQDNH